MVHLASLALVSVGFATALASTPTTAPSWLLQPRADPVTGCTCCGYDVSFGSDMDNMKTYFILNWAFGQGSTNTGFCFVGGHLEDSYVDMIHTAVETGKDSPYVNVTGAKTECRLMGWNTVDACVNGIVKGYERFIVGSDGTTASEWIHKGCKYPPANYVPTDCYCGWVCEKGFVQCGDKCIDPTITQCQSDIPVPKRRSSIMTCSAGAELCPVPSFKGFECVDTSANLEACGACPFQPGSVDCTTLPGVQTVQCVAGQCQVESCSPGYVLVDNECRFK